MNQDDIPPKYEVGYCKPPKHSQFKKGQSGNKRGRPKAIPRLRDPLKYELAPETLKNTFLEEAYRMVSINTAGGEESIPISQAVIRALGVKAAKGHVHAQRLFAQTLISIETERRRESENSLTEIIEYKKYWTKVLDHRASSGLPLDPPVPHPDDIILNMNTGAVEVRGPLCELEKAKQDEYRNLLEEYTLLAERCKQTLAEPMIGEIEAPQRKYVKEQLERYQELIPMLVALTGGEKPVIGTRRRRLG